MRGTLFDVEPDRFDDVGFEILEVPDTARRRRPWRRPRRRLFAFGVLAGAFAALAAAAALAVTPAQAPQRPAASSAPSWVEFAADRYPSRHGKRGPCKAGEAHPAGPAVQDESSGPRY
jgi:hypothetical protein